MNEREYKILDAAIAVFSRYGVRKATMGDIAEQAGISRPTLYARYANKDEIMAAAMHLISARVVEEVTEAWGSAAGIGERLDIFLDCAVVRFFDQIQQMPDASDLLTGHGEVSMAAHSVADQGKINLLAELFEARKEALAERGSSPVALAEFIYAASSNFKFTARDAAHLKSLLATLRQTAMVMLGES